MKSNPDLELIQKVCCQLDSGGHVGTTVQEDFPGPSWPANPVGSGDGVSDNKEH